jgi:hypothetical protein
MFGAKLRIWREMPRGHCATYVKMLFLFVAEPKRFAVDDSTAVYLRLCATAHP